MMVEINGQTLDAAGKTVEKYLTESGYHLKRIAVELNGKIIPRKQYDITVLKEGDVMEVVSFVGGG